MQSYTTLSLLEVLIVFLATCFGSYTEPFAGQSSECFVCTVVGAWNFNTPTIVRANHSENQPADGSVYEPKHVARNTVNTSNKLRVVYDYIIL